VQVADMAHSDAFNRALFAGLPDTNTILLTVAFVVVVAVLAGMAVSLWAGRGH
jgi:hypothetical protein